MKTILDFGEDIETRRNGKGLDIENMEMTYIPKSEHLARLKMYRLDNMKQRLRSKVGPSTLTQY